MNVSAADEGPLDLLDFTRSVIEALASAQAVYLLGGALAMAAWAQARSTLAVEFTVRLTEAQAPRLSEELSRREVPIAPEAILDWLAGTRDDSSLAGYHTQWGYKAQLFAAGPGDERRGAALARRKLIDLGEPLGPVYVPTPEDLLLDRLQTFSLTQQPEPVRDVTALLLAQGAGLDRAYLNDWTRRLGLDAIWRFVLAQV